MKTTSRISETEWEIMRIIWRQHPITAAEIIEQLLAQDSTWHPKTARTLLGRLVAKKALGHESQGRLYVYRPLVKEEDCVSAASQSFLERVFDGSLQPMLAHFVQHSKLTRNEINELKRLLNDKEDI
jgi:BlaI family penicillinase repressor